MGRRPKATSENGENTPVVELTERQKRNQEKKAAETREAARLAMVVSCLMPCLSFYDDGGTSPTLSVVNNEGVTIAFALADISPILATLATDTFKRDQEQKARDLELLQELLNRPGISAEARELLGKAGQKPLEL